MNRQLPIFHYSSLDSYAVAAVGYRFVTLRQLIVLSCLDTVLRAWGTNLWCTYTLRDRSDMCTSKNNDNAVLRVDTKSTNRLLISLVVQTRITRESRYRFPFDNRTNQSDRAVAILPIPILYLSTRYTSFSMYSIRHLPYTYKLHTTTVRFFYSLPFLFFTLVLQCYASTTTRHTMELSVRAEASEHDGSKRKYRV